MSAMPERPTTPISVTIGLAVVAVIIGLIVLMWVVSIVGTLLKLAFFIVIGAAILTAALRLMGEP